MSDFIALTDLPAELVRITGGVAPGYKYLWRKIKDGHLPGQKGDFGRIVVRRDDLPKILKVLGLKTKEAGDV